MGVSVLAGAIACLCSLVSAQNLSAIRDYSVIVSGNFTTSSDVYGRTVVGNNLTVNNSANFAGGLKNKVGGSSLTVRVGGSLSGGNPIQVEAGSFELAGSRNGRIINFNGGGSLIMNPDDDYTGLYNDLASASTALRQLPSNSSFTKPGSQPAPLTFIAQPDRNGLATFNISGADLFGNSKVQQIDLLANGATDFLFNVSGTSLSFNYGNFTGLFNDPLILEKIVWNFYEAESLNLGSKTIGGLVLAPHADVTAGTVIRGTVVAENLSTTAKIDTPSYTGVFSVPGSSPIPEPSSVFAAITGLGFLLLVRRRK